MKIGVYPGSFDPVTFGHLDIMKRGVHLFDKLYVVVSTNLSKNNLFTAPERAQMLKLLTKDIENIEVISSAKLTVGLAKELGATHILRGLRVITDFENEFQMTLANRKLDSSIDTVFMMTDSKFSFLSSSIVREIAKFKGDLKDFVPNIVKEKIEEKLY